MNWADVLAAALGAGGGLTLIFGIIKALIERRSETTSKPEEERAMAAMGSPPLMKEALQVSRAALGAVTELNAKVDGLERENEKYRQENDSLWSWVDDVRGNWTLHRKNPRPPARPRITVTEFTEGGGI